MLTPASAQEFTPLEGVVIYSANRTPTEAAKVGSSVEVITENDLRARSQTYLKDYLETLPGVSFSQNGPPGTTAGIRIRGGEGRYVKVLIDGIDVSDPSNVETAAHFEHLMVGDVARIEVLKGPQSTLYGGEAVSGVITVETKAARTLGFSHSGGAEYGAYNTFRGAYTAGYLAENGSNISLTAQGVTSDGFSAAAAGTEDDGYRNLTFSGRGEYYVAPGAKVFFAARSTQARYEYDDNFPPPDFIVNDSLAYGKYRQHAGRVGTEFKLLNGAFTNTFAVQGTSIERDVFTGYGTKDWFEGDRVKGEYKGVLRLNEKVSLLTGVDVEQTGAKNSNAPTTRNTAEMTSVYSLLMVEPIAGLALTFGGRIDDHSNFGTFDTHRITGAYTIPGTETKFHGNIGTAFRAPSLDELYGAYSFTPYYSNPNLRPEESEGWEAGIEQGFHKGKYTLGATYFHMDTENLIAFAGACSPTEPCMINIPGTTTREGVEVTATARITPTLSLFGGYTYVDTERGDTGMRIVRVPRHMFSSGIDWKATDKIHANVVAKYVVDTLDAGVQLDDYWLVNAKVSYEFTPGWKAYIRGENLLDEKYQTVLNYKTPGLSVYGGIQFALPPN
jgi:vitamin B12 transporter